jgi:DHA1 family inner membrane transport protein
MSTTTTDQPGSAAVIPILSAANFVIGMGAFMVIGLVEPVAEGLQISTAATGWMLIAYSLGYALMSPILVSATGAIGRRRILAIGLGIFALASLAAAMAPTALALFAARFVAAAGAGLVTPVTAAVAAGLSAPDRQARALAAVFFGLTLAQVVGVPAGGWIAYTFGWRAAFLVVFAMALPIIALVWTRVPAGLSFQPVALSDLGRILAQPRLVLALSFTGMFLGALYVLFTYISPLLTQTMGYGRDGITLYLLVSGVGAVVGNIIGGQATDRIGPFRTLLVLCAAQILLLPLYALLPLPGWSVMLMSFIGAAFGWSFGAAQQTRLIGLAPERASVMLALNSAAIYVGGAIGSAIGALTVANLGLLAVGPVAALCSILAAAVLLISERWNRRFL